MSNQIFSAVLKISHSFHCEGPMVQLGTVGYPWMTLSSLEEKNPRASYRLSPDDAAASCTAELFHDRLLWCALLHK